MISRTLLKLIGSIVSFTRLFYASPFEWDKKSSNFKYLPSVHKRFTRNQFPVLINYIHVVGKTLYRKQYGPPGPFYFLWGCSLVFTVHFILVGLYVRKGKELGVVFTAYIHYLQDFYVTYGIPNSKRILFYNKTLHYIAYLLIPGDIYAVCITFFVALFQYDADYLVYSSFRPIIPSKYKFQLYILATSFNIHNAFYGAQLVTVSAALLLPIIFLNPLLDTEFKAPECTRGIKYSTFNRLRQLDNLCYEYRRLEILIKSGLRELGPILIPIQFVAGQLGLMANYVLLKHSHEIDNFSLYILVGTSIVVQASWVIILTSAGIATQDLSEIICSWKHLNFNRRSDRKLMSKFRRACRPVVLGYESYFRIRRMSGVKYLNGFMRGTLRVLLTIA